MVTLLFIIIKILFIKYLINVFLKFLFACVYRNLPGKIYYQNETQLLFRLISFKDTA